MVALPTGTVTLQKYRTGYRTVTRMRWTTLPPYP